MAAAGALTLPSGSAAALYAAATPVTYGVAVKARSANAGKVYLGFASTVTAGGTDATDGWELAPGDETFVSAAELSERGLTLDAANLYVRGTTGDKVDRRVL